MKQDRITENVIAAIEPKLQSAEIERLKQKPASSLDAYDLLLRAQQFEFEYTEESLNDAIRHVEQALAIDPAYAPAMALGAYCYAERRNQGWVKNLKAEAGEGLRLAQRAVELEAQAALKGAGGRFLAAGEKVTAIEGDSDLRNTPR